MMRSAPEINHALRQEEISEHSISTKAASLLDGLRQESTLSSEKLCDAVGGAIARYPEPSDYPYHNKGHGIDVVNSAAELISQVPGDLFDDRQKGLLVLAAAWHDAGYGDDASQYPEGINEGEKECYAVHLFREYAAKELGELTDGDKDFVERAIMGTVMRPSVDRNSPEAALLHMADIAYLFDKSLAIVEEPGEWVQQSIRAFWDECAPDMSPKDFIDFEISFLRAEALEVRQLAGRLKLGQKLSDEYGARVLGAMGAARLVAHERALRSSAAAAVGATALQASHR